MDIIGLKLPFIKAGDDLPALIIQAIEELSASFDDHDIVVVTEKIVAKSQGSLVKLDTLNPCEKALKIAGNTEKDPRLVELILRESKKILKTGPEVIITETHDGFVCANAGIDASNVKEGYVKVLPRDPDNIAKEYRDRLFELSGKKVGVVISDSFGRPFRSGSVGVALGSAGIIVLWDRKGHKDLYGKTLKSTRVALADLIASTANLITGEADEGIPAVLIKGLKISGRGSAKDLLRDPEEDLFRPKET